VNSKETIFSNYELLPTPLIIFSNKKVIYLNNKAAELLELSNSKKLTEKELNIFNYLLPEYITPISERNKKILSGKILEAFPIKVRTKKGRVIDIDTKSTRIKIDGKYYIITIFFEVTKEINLINQLKSSDEVLNLIGKSKTDIIFKYNYGKEEGFSYISDSVSSILGYQASLFYKNKNLFTSLIHPDDLSKIPVSKAKFLKWLEISNRSTLRYITKSNSVVWLETHYTKIDDVNGKTIAVSGICRDITKEKDVERQLQVTEEQLSLIAENAHDIIYFFTYHPKPKYFFISNSVEKILGYKPEEFYNDPFFINKKTVGKTNRLKEDEKLAALQQKSGKLPLKRIDYQVYNSKGEIVWMEDHVSPIKDEKGNISFLFGIVRNIDDLKRKEGELNQKWSDYKYILDLSPLAFFIHDNGICKLCNKTAVDLLKVKSEKQVIGSNLFSYVAPKQRTVGKKRIKMATEGAELDFKDYQMQNAKGELKNIQIKTVPITYNGKACALSLVKDITEIEKFEKNRIKAELIQEHNKQLLYEIELRKEAEKRVAGQNLKLSAIFENSTHLFWTVDSRYKLTYFNKNFEIVFKRKYGLKPLIGQSTHELLKGSLFKENKNFWLPYYKKAFKGERFVIDRLEKSVQEADVIREIFINPIYSSDGKILEVSCMANDVSEKKRNEIKLMEQTARINAIFESGSQIIWTVDPDFRYTSFNNNYRKALKELVGIEPKIGEASISTSKVSHQDQAFWKIKYKEVLLKKAVSFITERVNLKGNIVVRQFFLNPIVSKKGEVVEISGIGKDITEKALSEKKIIQQSAKLNALFDGSSHYIWTVDRKNNLTGFNLNYTKLIKSVYNSIPRIGQPLNRGRMKGDNDYIASMSKYYDKVFKGENVNFELQFFTSNEKKIFLDVFLNPIYHEGDIIEISGIAHDITDKRNAIEKLKQSEEKSRAVINAIPDILFTIDNKGVFLDVKVEDESALFFKPQQFLGKPLSDFFPGQLGIDFMQKINDAIKSSKTHNLYYFYDHLGNRHHYEARYRSINTNECLVLIRDITSAKQNEDKITQSLKEKEVLLKEVHHRVKNNMQIISSILNLQSSYTTDSAILALLRESQNRIKTMAYIHESLYQNKTFSSVNFNEYLSQLISNVVHSYSVSPEKIKLLINCDKVVLNLDVSIPLGLIINELVTNAIKHAFPSTSKGIISVNLTTEKNLVTLNVQDNGIGIDTEVSPENSNSLGLQLVYTLIDQIDGKITFELLKPHGTRVNISFVI
jgi:PAS domain S-box-containing protein